MPGPSDHDDRAAHVVPRGFMRIRHYGLLANCQRTHKLARCRQLLGHTPPMAAPAGLEDQASGSTADTPPEAPPPPCPICSGPVRVVERRAPSPHDTS